ncbi:hypothetical protein CAPTEDRAFT_222636 [Capitella teleta]|uniref:Uncharacterized protein n=1 Tax=Capitella teleta TaxID=283909 RepID=R7UCY7_CAPTE|nr:hypothetical protein CAPTEDRAFT_222636 [Capitella teleta]|eukprot:ELU03936.1 hypothetical protein CAPTEDRAFT_222636 [Capitella teleta]
MPYLCSRNNPGRSAAWQNAPTETHSTQEQRMAQKQSKRQSLSALEVNSSGRNHHAMGSTPNLHNAKHTHSTSEGLQPWHSTTDMSNRSPHMRKSVSQSSWDEHDPRIVQSTGNVNHHEDPPSPPAPPVRDASSLKFMTVSQPGHEKFPSWPVTTASAHDTNSHAANNRTSSWSDSTQTSAELPPKPRMAYQPVLNTHAEENGVKRLLQENRVKARNSDFHRAVVTKLEGASQPGAEPPDLKHFYNSHPPYPHPQYDRDGRVREDKDYAVPSPPERDTPESVKESRYYTSASSIALMAKNKPYYRMDNANTKETSAAAEPQQPEPQVPVTKAPPPRIPATIKENEEAKKGELREDVIEKINELPSHQSWMLRKLSQEFYGQQSRYGMGVTSPKRIDHKPDEPKVKIEEEVKENKEDLMTWFDRRSRNQMSIRKAYGISDDGVQEKPPPHHAKSLSLDSENKQDGFFGKKKKEKKEKKKKKKQEKDGERLKRSSSEQFNSNKELSPKDEDRKRPSSETIRPASSEERVPQVQAFNTPRKRFSASSLDASHLDWSGANEIRRKKSLSLPRDTAREMKRSSLQSNPSQRNSGHTDSELSPPPLLDITASNYNSLSPQVDYSPPPHPWGPLSAASPKHPIRSYEDGTRPDLLQEGKIPKETDKPLPNSYEYSDR